MAASDSHKHCGSNHRCIALVAERACRANPGDDHHCDIIQRWLVAKRLAHAARVHTLESVFEICVANLESGGDFTTNTGNGYLGGFQFLPSTWSQVTGMMGVSWPLEDSGGRVVASQAEQLMVFRFWEARDPNAWPITVPACGGP